jgi:8-oxo-dGTP pyrophosphatase MutT (NUDIX family)
LNNFTSLVNSHLAIVVIQYWQVQDDCDYKLCLWLLIVGLLAVFFGVTVVASNTIWSIANRLCDASAFCNGRFGQVCAGPLKSATISPMIAREWHGWTSHDNAHAYETLLRETIIPNVEAKGLPGYRGVQVLRYDGDNDEVKFKIIFYFETLENVKGVAGEVVETAVLSDLARQLLKRFEPLATHYEVVMRVDRPRGHMDHLHCNNELRHYITTNLRDFPFRSGELRDGNRAAAVAITLVHVAHKPDLVGIPFETGWEDQAAILLTRRSAKLKKHAGQWALPGGRIDKGEKPEETALRELEEEVGLALGMERVIGRLDDYTTRSGFTIKPVVVWGGRVTDLISNPDEVQAIHRIPVAEFMREDAPILQNIPESDNPILLMPIGESWIAAPTAAMLYQFREVCILGKHTRVAHFEQPYFAWK